LAQIDPPQERYPEGKDVVLHQRLEQAIAAAPGVQGVTLMSTPYLTDSMSMMSFITEAESADPTKAHSERDEEVGNRFFETLGIPILAGRSFAPQDTATSAKVAVINQSLAQTRFPQGNPVGQRFRLEGDKGDWIQVVGICADTRYQNLREDIPPQYFLPYVQQTEVGGMSYVIRTGMPQEAIVPALRRAMAQIDPDLPLEDVRTEQEQIGESMRMERALAALIAGFGLLALALAAVGIYGIMAYSVANRRNEIGIRLALGAQSAQVRGMILRESAWLTAAGIVAGVGAALLPIRLVRSMLYGIQPYDPTTMTVGILVLLAVAMAASWIPARRAARVQPMEALRHE
jgi:predicted permease